MSDGMLGRLPLSQIRGPVDALMNNLAGAEGEIVLAELKKFNRKQACWKLEEKSGVISASLVRLMQTALGELPGIKTDKCLRSRIWAYRDGNFDSWLPKEQAKQAGCKVDAYQLAKPMVFAEMAAVVLGVQATTPIEELGRMLKERGLTLSLSQLDKLVEMQESGVDVGIRTDGWAGFAFMENTDGCVSVAGVDRDDRRWDGYLYSLSHVHRWHAGLRLLLRNSDAQTL